MIFNRVQYFNSEIQNSILISKNNYTNIFEIPMLDNITVVLLFNSSKKKSKYYITTLMSILYLITGQYPTYIKSNKKVIIGCKVVLRTTLLYFFLDKFNSLIISYIKDFKLIRHNFINDKTLQICFKQLNVFFELDSIYKNFPKYFLRFSQFVNCFIYFKFTKAIPVHQKENILTLNQISFTK